jgi:hypothetical protein
VLSFVEGLLERAENMIPHVMVSLVQMKIHRFSYLLLEIALEDLT